MLNVLHNSKVIKLRLVFRFDPALQLFELQQAFFKQNKLLIFSRSIAIISCFASPLSVPIFGCAIVRDATDTGLSKLPIHKNIS